MNTLAAIGVVLIALDLMWPPLNAWDQGAFFTVGLALVLPLVASTLTGWCYHGR